MIYKYELACKAAGLSKEQTAEIRNYFDAEKKRLKRQNETIRRMGYKRVSIDAPVDSETYGPLDIPDPDINVEEEALKNIELQRMNDALLELPEDDREFLFAIFEDLYGAESRIAKKLNLTRGQVRQRKKKLIEDLRRRMGVVIKS